MFALRFATFGALMSVSACAGRYHTEIVGQGTALVQPRTELAAQANAEHPPWAVAGGIELPAGTYDLALAFDVPRAQLIEWTVTCPGAQLSGSEGETFEAYRARRIAEIRAEREREIAAPGSAFTPALRSRGYVGISAALGNGQARATVGTTATAVTAVDTTRDASGDATVDTRASGDAITLPPGDVGTARLINTVRVVTSARGVCAVIAASDDAAVLGTYQVTRVRDGQSVAQPARRRIAAEVLTVGVDPDAQAMAAQQQAAEQRAAQEQITAQASEPPGEVHARGVIDIQQRRLDIALHTRDLLRKRWTAWGAIPRPPMPALLAENAGEPPFPGAVWTPGRWVWIRGRWEWRPGSWSDPDVFLDTEVFVGAEIGTGIGIYDETLRDHRSRERIRDHRDGDSGSTIRDHRDDTRSSSKPEPTVRDHRNHHDDTPQSTVRDHRDDKKDKDDDDDKRSIRDHRRR